MAVALGLAFGTGLIPLGSGDPAAAPATTHSPTAAPTSPAEPARTPSIRPSPTQEPKDAPDPCTLIPRSALDKVVPKAPSVALPARPDKARKTCFWAAKSQRKGLAFGRSVSIFLEAPAGGAAQALSEWRSNKGSTAKDEAGLGDGAFSSTAGSGTTHAIAFGRNNLAVYVSIGGWRQLRDNLGVKRTPDPEEPATLRAEARALARATVGKLPAYPVRIDLPDANVKDKFGANKLPKNCKLLSDATVRQLVPRATPVRGGELGGDDRVNCRALTRLDANRGPRRDIRISVEKKSDAEWAKTRFITSATFVLTDRGNEVTYAGTLPELGDDTLVVAGTEGLSNLTNGYGKVFIRRGLLLIEITYTGVNSELSSGPDPMSTKKAYDGAIKIAREFVGRM